MRAPDRSVVLVPSTQKTIKQVSTSSSELAKRIGSEIANSLGPDYTYARSRLELCRSVPEGHDVIVLSVSAKYSPHINVAFYFGKRFAVATKVEKALGGYRFPYHVQQYSMNRQPLYQPTYSGADNWNIDLSEGNDRLATEISAAIRGMAHPFFEEFAQMERARDAIANGERSCFSGAAFWRQLLILDAALGDLTHFEEWITSLDSWTREHAKAELADVRALQSLI